MPRCHCLWPPIYFASSFPPPPQPRIPCSSSTPPPSPSDGVSPLPSPPSSIFSSHPEMPPTHALIPSVAGRRGSVHFYRVNSFAISYERTHTITSTWRKRLSWLHHSTVHAPSPRLLAAAGGQISNFNGPIIIAAVVLTHAITAALTTKTKTSTRRTGGRGTPENQSQPRRIGRTRASDQSIDRWMDEAPRILSNSSVLAE